MSLILAALLSAPPKFVPQLLGVDLHESCAVGDIDQDGSLDIAAGRHWFRNGEWVARPLREIEDRNGYSVSNSDFFIDADGDGDPDVLSGNYFDGEVAWYENRIAPSPDKPGVKPPADAARTLWPKHVIGNTGQNTNELYSLVDLDGDSTPELIANQWKDSEPLLAWRFSRVRDRLVGMTPYEISGAVAVDVPSNGHGFGVGDLTGDRLDDIIVGSGWYEQTPDGPWTAGGWTHHTDWQTKMSLPVLVGDFTDDGEADLIFGTPHDRGMNLWKGPPPFAEADRTVFDESFSQAHAVHLADVDSDGEVELITGKRVLAHNGRDPGSDEQPQVVYFELDDLAAGPRVIERGRVGIGLKIESADLDGDKDVDLVVNGKGGLFILWNGARP